MHYTLPLISYAAHTETVAASTSDVFRIPPNVKRASFELLAGVLHAGTTPTLDARVQVAPTTAQSNAWFTSMPCYRTGTAPNSIGGIMAFTQMTTAGKALKYSEHPGPFVRAIYSVGGATVHSSFGLMMTCFED